MQEEIVYLAQSQLPEEVSEGKMQTGETVAQEAEAEVRTMERRIITVGQDPKAIMEVLVHKLLEEGEEELLLQELPRVEI